MRRELVKDIATNKTIKDCHTCRSTELVACTRLNRSAATVIGRSSCGKLEHKHTVYVWRNHKHKDRDNRPSRRTEKSNLLKWERDELDY
jgi:hypothetical protein